jgi:hypothetical protein
LEKRAAAEIVRFITKTDRSSPATFTIGLLFAAAY